MKHDVRAMLERADQIRRGQRGIEHQRYACLVGNLGDLLDINQQITGVAERFAEKQPRVRTHRRVPRIEIARVHERCFDAESRQRVIEQIV